MKKFFVLFVMLIPALSWAEVSIGVVDMQTVLTSITDGKAIMKQLEGKFNIRKKELKESEDKIKKAQEAYQKQRMVLSETAQRKKEKELQKMVIELQTKTMEYQKEINKMEQELKKPLIGKVQKIVLDVSKKAKVDLTFEMSSAPILYAKKRLDLTTDVVNAYNKQHPEKK